MLCIESRQFSANTIAFSLPPPASGSSVGGDPVRVFAEIFQQQKTRVPGLSCSNICVILYLAISAEHQIVTDRQTNKWTDT